MRRIIASGLACLAALAAAGCVEKATHLQGQDLSALVFRPYGAAEGVFPDVSVLQDPANPFADVSYQSIDAVHNPDALQWKLNGTAAHVARFYIWATILAKAAPAGDGEAQYYAASALQDVYYFAKAAPADLPAVRDLAILGFTQVLTSFAGRAVTYDATGTIAYELLTPSLQSLLDLGGTAPAGWILVKDDKGMPRAVKQ